MGAPPSAQRELKVTSISKSDSPAILTNSSSTASHSGESSSEVTVSKSRASWYEIRSFSKRVEETVDSTAVIIRVVLACEISPAPNVSSDSSEQLVTDMLSWTRLKWDSSKYGLGLSVARWNQDWCTLTDMVDS